MNTSSHRIKTFIQEIDPLEGLLLLAAALTAAVLLTFVFLTYTDQRAEQSNMPEDAPSGYAVSWRCQSGLAFSYSARNGFASRIPEWDRYCPSETG